MTPRELAFWQRVQRRATMLGPLVIARAIWSAVLAAATIAVIVALFVGWRNCRRSGGVYVHGVFWMECIRR
jgi:hypothetical protein